jgi:hypothetical protein
MMNLEGIGDKKISRHYFSLFKVRGCQARAGKPTRDILVFSFISPSLFRSATAALPLF